MGDIFDGGDHMSKQGKTLEAKAECGLRITPAGVSQYATVNSSDIGEVKILPQPRDMGLQAQAFLTQGKDVKIQYVGEQQGVKWGILLDSQGKQYGKNMDYSPEGIVVPQVFYVGPDSYFARKRFNRDGPAKKHNMTIDVFGTDIDVRFGSLEGKNTDEDLKIFQGYVVGFRSTGKNVKTSCIYRAWVSLTADNLKNKFCSEREMQNITSWLGKGNFSFFGDDRIDANILEEICFSEDEDNSLASIIIKGEKKKDYELNIEPGSYSVQEIIKVGMKEKKRGWRRKLLNLYDTHLAANPVSLEDVEGKSSQVNKDQRITIKAGGLYQLNMYDVVAAQEAVQPCEPCSADVVDFEEAKQKREESAGKPKKKASPPISSADPPSPREKRKERKVQKQSAAGEG